MTSNNKEKYSLFSYSWDFTEERLEDQREYERTNIKIFGINESGENIYVSIDDFEPFVYLEIPTEIPKDKYSLIPDAIDGRIIEKYGTYKNGEPKFGPTSKTLVYRKKLYFTHKDKNMKDIEFPYILMTFSTMSHVKKFGFALFNQIHIKGVGRFKFKLHEQDASPILQLISRRNLPSAGWIEFTGMEVDEDNKESYCQKEYKTSWKKLVPSAKTTSVNPLVMAVDIEVNSSNPNVMPNADNAKDKVFQISCVVARTGQEEKDFAKYILSLGEPDQKITGEDVIIKSYKRECDLLDGYAELINTLNPNIIVGYNVFGFDFPYMIKRADNTNCDNFRKQGFIAGKSGKEKIIKWSSSAYKNQEFRFLDCYGILFIDLLPIIKRDFKFDNYRLKTIAEFFTGKTKDPLTPKDIFSCYRKFTPKSLGIVAKYCVQDSVLVLKLVDVLKTWVGLTEMAKTCNVPIITLFTQGQQIKIYSQVFKFCLNTYVVEKDAFVTGSDEKYTGAFVFDPVPGLYDMVVSFDFSSLYPSSIIAYNIDYSTLVRDENIPDDKCHVIEWEEHKNCIHDEVVRKGKQTEKTCQKYRYRFLKEPKGIIPTILQNMLDMRKKTNGEISVLKDKLKEEKNEEKIKDIKTMIDVLDKRQLSYKVNANSMYGGMGVKKGYLPFLPGAMCTTAKGRESIAKASKYIQEHYGGKLIYGDTDSCYVNFPMFNSDKDAGLCYDFCKRVEDEMLSLFPRPMKLAYEEKIYWRFFILTKKRYMALVMDRNGKVSNNIFKRGVLLNRRDNSKFIRDIYSDTILKIFYKSPQETILQNLIDKINNLYTKLISSKDMVVTKAVGSLQDYKIKVLSEDDKKCKKRLVELLEVDGDVIDNIDLDKVRELVNKMISEKAFSLEVEATKEYEIARQYLKKSLPSQVQLSIRMAERGKAVDAGTRLEYVIINYNGSEKLFDKIEDIDYYKEHSSVLELDCHYYLKLLSKPIDQMLNVAFGVDKFIEKHYKQRLIRSKLNNELKNITKPKIEIIN